jgi:hypothetical protein
LKPYNTEHRIIGDQNAVKNGWIYAVWGPSSDPTKWQEQNITVKGVVRPLNRYLISKQESVIVEEKAKS